MKRFNRWLAGTVRQRGVFAAAVAQGFKATALGGSILFRHPLIEPFISLRAAAASEDEFRSGLVEWVVMGRLTLDGVKCVRLSPDQAAVMAATDLTLPWRDYRQPFPAIAVVLPDDFPAAGPDLPRPSAILLHHDPAAGVLLVAVIGDQSSGDRSMSNTFVLPPVGDDDPPDIERRTTGLDPVEASAVRSLTRVALNTCLLLTTHGCHHVGKANPGYAAKLRASLDKKKLPPAVRAANERAMRDMPDIYSFAQDIVLSRHEGDTDTVPGDPTGRQMPAHWRRGHWANLACGAGRAERRLHFRPPVMVRADRFAGVPAATAATYRLPAETGVAG